MSPLQLSELVNAPPQVAMALAAEAYMVCDKDENAAANYLFARMEYAPRFWHVLAVNTLSHVASYAAVFCCLTATTGR